jgi:hypothetical protein
MRIDTYAKLIQVLTLQKANLTTYQTQVGATLADITEVTNELNNLNAMTIFCQQVDAYKKETFGMKDTMWRGELATPIVAFPAALVPPTLTAALAGALQRTLDRNRRFKAAPGYTHDIGVALGIESSDDVIGVDVTPPIVDVFPSESGYLFSVVVTGRGQSDAWDLLARPAGSNTWKTLGYGTSKSKDFTYNPGPTAGEGVPIQLSLRVQLKKKDGNLGNPSDIVLATVNP